MGARPAVVGTETTTILRRWEIERLRRFRHGNKKLLHADGILATYFEPVEFFRRVHGLAATTLGHWPELVRFYAAYGQSFLVDFYADDGPLGATLEGGGHLEFCYRNTLLHRALDTGADGGGVALKSFEPEVLPVDARTISTFSRIYLTCFEASSTSFEIAQENLNALLGMPGWYPYLVRVRGQFAGCYSFFQRGSVILLSSAATLPEFRNLGLQQFMIGWRLAQARQLEAECAVTYGLTGSTSVSNLKKLGFRETHEKLTFRYRFPQ